jgi:outer membrane protein insertion porin family
LVRRCLSHNTARWRLALGSLALAYLTLSILFPTPAHAQRGLVSPGPVTIVNEQLLERTPTPITGRVFFEGNSVLDDDTLLERMAIVPHPWLAWGDARPLLAEQLRNDAVRVANMYKRMGYYNARVERIELADRDPYATVIFVIREGDPMPVEGDAEVVFLDPPLPPEIAEGVTAASQLLDGDLFSENNYLATQRFMRGHLRNAGFYAATVTPQAWVFPERYAANVTYFVDSGARVRFGTTEIVGAETLDPHLIRRELRWKEDTWFQENQVEATLGHLYGLNLFRTVQIAPAYPDRPTDPMPMVITVTEAPHQTLRLGFGYGTEDQFRVQAIYSHFNLLGGGRQFRATLRLSAILQQFETRILQPHVFSPDNSVSILSGYRRERRIEAFSFERYTLTPRFNRRFTPRLSGFVGYLIEWNEAFDVGEGVPIENRESADPGLLSGAVAGAEWNNVDNLLRPTHGNVTRINLLHAGLALGGRFDFYRWLIDSQQFIRPYRRWVIVLRVRAGVAEPYGDSRVPLYEKFFAGGDDSIRGYRRDKLGPAIGGLSLFEGSTEVRRRVGRAFWVAAFTDMGMVGLDSYSWESNQVRYGVGPGIRFDTLVGLIRVDLGIPLNPRVGEPNWRAHLSIGQAF